MQVSVNPWCCRTGVLSTSLFRFCCNCTKSMPLFHNLLDLAPVESSSLCPLPHSCSFSCLFSCGFGSHVANKTGETIRVRAHLAKIRRRLVLTGASSAPAGGSAAPPALPVTPAETLAWPRVPLQELPSAPRGLGGVRRGHCCLLPSKGSQLYPGPCGTPSSSRHKCPDSSL